MALQRCIAGRSAYVRPRVLIRNGTFVPWDSLNFTKAGAQDSAMCRSRMPVIVPADPKFLENIRSYRASLRDSRR
jgi:hypothetical protein